MDVVNHKKIFDALGLHMGIVGYERKSDSGETLTEKEQTIVYTLRFVPSVIGLLSCVVPGLQITFASHISLLAITFVKTLLSSVVRKRA